MISPDILRGATLLVLAFASNAFAAGTSPFKPISAANGQSEKPENYLGASIGKSSADSFCTSLQNCEDTDKSWKLFAGVRMNENIVLEGGYVNFGELTGKDAGNEVSQTATAFTLTGVAGFTMNEQIELFGKAGAARWSQEQVNAGTKTDSSGTDILVGAGANYDLGDNMGIRAEWERFKDVGSSVNKADIDLLSVGLTFSSL
ncbi:MAG: outer membrane beta-barrel protein [Gammaproteobacteria bacterium]|nr:outer membrane beta-barrel protein [Gammaproteobacteria bacterium]MBU1723296.1 outer membrane beta-barrel protein [Gammaproteobacteria bacterium]MBU2006591.1 outer membrane beta-barrel protein [Gammaproteobacteria bacterium]